MGRAIPKVEIIIKTSKGGEEVMKISEMYVCDECGYSRERPGVCYYCQNPLNEYATELFSFYQLDKEESLRIHSMPVRLEA